MWTIDELVERVGAALAAEYPGAPNGRVRDVPDRRAVRWYATTGLVDRPSAMRGRTALYETRHLLQLVAVKRLQADGRTLAEIQVELAGATDARLAAVARIPGEPPAAGGQLEEVRARPRFWASPLPSAAPDVDTATVAVTPDGTGAAPDALTGVVLTGGVVVLVPGSPSPADRAAIASAAQPLLDLLSARGLTNERDSS